MDTKIIEYVIAIAEEKSLSKAAERLYLSQPALSQRLKKLEDELGTPLFVRGKDGLSITDAGRIYVNGGHSILQIKREALKKLTSMNPRQAKNTLRFACATSSAIECIPTFRKACSDIELLIQRCNTPKAKEDLIMGRADLGVLLTSSILPWNICRSGPENCCWPCRKDIRSSPRRISTPAISMASGATILFLPALPPTDGTVKNRHCA